MENSLHYFKSSKFIKSIIDIKEAPEKRLSEVLFVGKSNVGKSSLINALTNNKRLAYTSSKPGHTRLLNYFLIDNSFYFVDAPGYGFSTKKDLDYKFYGEMIENYFKNNKYLKLIVFLLDSRHEPTEDDLDFYNYLKSTDYNFIFVMTKCDKLNMSLKSKIVKNLKNVFIDPDLDKLNLVSIKDNRSLLALKTKIEEYIK